MEDNCKNFSIILVQKKVNYATITSLITKLCEEQSNEYRRITKT